MKNRKAKQKYEELTRVNISLEKEMHKDMMRCAKAMGLSLSAWIQYIAIDKIHYFERHAEKFYKRRTAYARIMINAAIKRKEIEKDIDETIAIAQELWKD